MADSSRMTDFIAPPALTSLDEAIALIESGKADPSLQVDIGAGLLLDAGGRKGLDGLLQRLRGHRIILALASGQAADRVVAMRPSKPDMHPDVAIILDALKDQG